MSLWKEPVSICIHFYSTGILRLWVKMVWHGLSHSLLRLPKPWIPVYVVRTPAYHGGRGLCIVLHPAHSTVGVPLLSLHGSQA